MANFAERQHWSLTWALRGQERSPRKLHAIRLVLFSGHELRGWSIERFGAVAGTTTIYAGPRKSDCLSASVDCRRPGRRDSAFARRATRPAEPAARRRIAGRRGDLPRGGSLRPRGARRALRGRGLDLPRGDQARVRDHVSEQPWRIATRPPLAAVSEGSTRAWFDWRGTPRTGRSAPSPASGSRHRDGLTRTKAKCEGRRPHGTGECDDEPPQCD
jgi:hypothetical protein